MSDDEDRATPQDEKTQDDKTSVTTPPSKKRTTPRTGKRRPLPTVKLSSSSSGIIALAGAAGIINTAYAATHDRSVFKVGFASFLVVGALLGIGTLNADIAMMMAVLYFISSFMLNGGWLINFATSLVGGSK